jgi:hypothetical protein
MEVADDPAFTTIYGGWKSDIDSMKGKIAGLLTLLLTVTSFGKQIHAQSPASDAATFHVIDSGMTLWYNQPSAIFFSGQFHRTFFAYQNLRSEIIARFYDHDQHQFSQPAQIASWPQPDDHGSPTMWIVKHGKSKGHILLTYSLHASPLFLKRSTRPEDISSWSDHVVLDSGKCTYQSMVEDSNGKIFIFYTIQTDRRILAYRTSVDGGFHWGPAQKLIDFGPGTFVYAAPAIAKRKKICISWTIYTREGTDAGHKNIYAFCSEDIESVSTIGGRSDSLISASARPILETEQGRGNVVWDVKIDKHGHPVMAIVDHAAVTNIWTNCKAYYVCFNNRTKKWQKDYVTDLGAYYYPAGVVITGKKNNTLVLGRGNTEKTSIEEWQRGKRDRSWKMKRIISDPSAEWPQANPVIPKYRHRDLDLIWMEIELYQNKKYKCKLICRINSQP